MQNKNRFYVFGSLGSQFYIDSILLIDRCSGILIATQTNNIFLIIVTNMKGTAIGHPLVWLWFSHMFIPGLISYLTVKSMVTINDKLLLSFVEFKYKKPRPVDIGMVTLNFNVLIYSVVRASNSLRQRTPTKSSLWPCTM